MIRAAKKEDHQAAVKLIYSTIGKIAHQLTGTDRDDEVLRVLASFFQQEGNRVSYQNTLVKEVDGQVAGILISYHGSESEMLDKPFVERLKKITGKSNVTIQKEAEDDDYYLDTVAVADAYQGRGYGKELLLAFEDKARAAGYRKLALLAEASNEPAYSIYKKLGYQSDGSVTVSGYHFQHMVKFL